MNEIEPLITDSWRCRRCGEVFDHPKGERPRVCPNPNCQKKGPFKALSGPFTYFEDGQFIPKMLADDIMRHHHFITHRESGEIYYYTDGYYRPKGETLIEEECRKRLADLATEHRVKEVVYHIRETTYRNSKDFNPPKNLICLRNGVLDLTSGQLHPHGPNPIFLSRIPVDYDPAAVCPNFRKFLGEILEEDIHPLVQEMFGYCLLRDYPLARAFMLLGGGNNGKSTLLRILRALLGDENVSAKSLQDIVGDRFAAAELFGRLANVFADLPSRRLGSDTGRFKMLTGEDLMDAQRKHRDPFKFQNYAKLVFSANELPATADLSEAFWRRWILIKFNRVFPEGDPKTDPYIADKITGDPQEMSGILNWALEGLKRVLERGCFSFSRTNEEVMREWMLRTDSLRSFVLEYLTYDPDFAIAKADLYQLYTLYCEEHELTPMDKSLVGRRLPSLIPGISEERPYVEGKQIRVWVGVSFKTDKTDIQDVSRILLLYRGCKKNQPYFNIKINSQKYLDFCLSCLETNCKAKLLLEKIQNSTAEKTNGQKFSNLLGYLSQNVLCRFVANVEAVEVQDPEDKSKTILGPFVAGDVKELPLALAEEFRQKGWVEFVGSPGDGGSRAETAGSYLVTFTEDYPGQIVPTLKDPIAKGTALVLPTPEALELQRRFGFVELKPLGGGSAKKQAEGSE